MFENIIEMKTIVTITILVLNILTLFAFDFEVDNKYYNILNENSVEITFKDSLFNSYLDKTVIIPNSVVYQGKQYKVTQIGRHAFWKCLNINLIVIPESVKNIENSAFGVCENLAEIKLPNSIETIGGSAFALCKALASMSIPPKVISIEDMTFAGCENLESVEFPDSLTKIGNVAFFMCKKLKSVTLPEKIDNFVACSIFNNCENLQTMKMLSKIPPIVNPMMIKDIDFKKCKLFVPIGSISHYKNAEIWKEFANIEEF